MKTLKIHTLIYDKETGENIKPGTVIERDKERAKDFVKYSEDITPKPKKKVKKAK